MNKAFVREADDVAPRCPDCDSPGQEVLPDTLAAQLTPELRTGLTESAWFCAFDRCEVVYFDAFGRSVRAEQLARPVWPKDPSAPLCPCFGLTAADIELDLAEGTVTRTRACVQRAQSPEARCTLNNPAGRSCVAEVQGYYMKRRNERG